MRRVAISYEYSRQFREGASKGYALGIEFEVLLLTYDGGSLEWRMLPQVESGLKKGC